MILIVGAGPTGMTTAIELSRFGLPVRIIDKSDHMARYSQALVVQARTLEQLHRYGIADRAITKGRKLHRAEFWSEGKKIFSFGLEKIPSRYPYALFLPQNETEAILNEHMESLGVSIERGTELISFSQTNDCVAVKLRRPDGHVEEAAPRWIVGCDGAHSKVREAAAIPFEGESVDLSFFLGDLEIEGPDAPSDELAIHLHHGDVVFMGKLPGKFTRLIVALHERQGQDLGRDLMIKDFQYAVDQAGVRIKVLSSGWMTPFHVRDLQAQHYRAGNVFLAGDASHIHSPVGGQGMNTGMQDAANLAWKLAAVSRGASEALLDSYEEERGEVGKALLSSTGRALKMATISNTFIEELRDALLPFLAKSKHVQQTALGFVSETAIHYRFSSVVKDYGGDGGLRAGDRLPDLSLLNGNHESLLHDWTDAKHLAILFNGEPRERDELKALLRHARVFSLHDFQLDGQGRDLFGRDKKLVIVRPDGYIGFRGSLDNRSNWNQYASQNGLA